MAEIFISSACEDQAFVRMLYQALHENNREVWVDWQSIPPTAEWKVEILSAIENADNFLFVLSPYAIASPWCLLELEHTVKHNKRRIPIQDRSVETAEVPASITAYQWIDFNAEAEIDSSAASLIIAILDTDTQPHLPTTSHRFVIHMRITGSKSLGGIAMVGHRSIYHTGWDTNRNSSSNYIAFELK